MTAKNSFAHIFLLVLLLNVALKLDAEDQRFKIGVMLPLSGEVARYGEIVKAGVEEAKQKNVEFVYEDTACRSPNALSAYKKLHSIDGIQYFLGPCCGSPLKTVAPFFQKGQQLSMSLCGTSEEVNKLSKGKVFIPQYSIEQEDAFNAKQMWDMGLRKALIIFLDNEFSRAHGKGFS